MLYTFDFDVVTVICQLLINGYVMLRYVKSFCYNTLASRRHTDRQIDRISVVLSQHTIQSNLVTADGCVTV